MSRFIEGQDARRAGLAEADCPYIIGTTKLGNPRLAEGGEDWLQGWRSLTVRVASAAELAAARTIEVSRFRRKSNRYYGK